MDFPIHPICLNLTQQTKTDLIWNVDRSSPADKITDFVSRVDDLVDEMEHQSLLARHPLLAKLSTSGDLFKSISFGLAIAINIIILVFFRATEGSTSEEKPRLANKEMEDLPLVAAILTIFGIGQVISASIVVLSFLFNNAPLVVKRGWKNKLIKKYGLENGYNISPDEESEEEEVEEENGTRSTVRVSEIISFLQGGLGESYRRGWQETFRMLGVRSVKDYIKIVVTTLYFLLRDPLVLYYLAYIFVAFLGIFVNTLFFSFHLLDVVARFQVLKNVLRSVVYPWKVLTLTGVLYLIMVYMFTIFGFYFIREDFVDPDEGYTECDSLLECFFVTFDQGFKHDGGLGGYLEKRPLTDRVAYSRLLYDNLYNIILVIVLLNIVFGEFYCAFRFFFCDLCFLKKKFKH